jgi:DNA-binding transcriptional ArsR family regulator
MNFKPENALDARPIGAGNLNLFCGREQDLAALNNSLDAGARCVIIEGSPGIGKSSLGNYYRLEKARRGSCISPEIEINPSKLFSADHTLCAAFALAQSALKAELAARGIDIEQFGQYKKIRALSKALRRELKSRQAEYIESRVVGSSPKLLFLPDKARMGLALMAEMAEAIGYEQGILIQAGVGEGNNTPVNAIERLCFSDKVRFIITCRVGWGRAVAGKIQRVSWMDMQPLPIAGLRLIVHKILGSLAPEYRSMVIDPKIPEFVFKLTEGDLKYTFKMCSRLIQLLYKDIPLMDISLGSAGKIVVKLAEREISDSRPTPLAFNILKRLSGEKYMSTGGVTHSTRKKQAAVSRALSELRDKNLVSYHKVGRHHLYSACSAARVAFRAK